MTFAAYRNDDGLSMRDRAGRLATLEDGAVKLFDKVMRPNQLSSFLIETVKFSRNSYGVNSPVENQRG